MGEKVSGLPMANDERGVRWLVLVNPGFGVSTGDIYSRYSLSLTSVQIPITHTISALKEGDAILAVKSLFNALQDTVFRKYPLIEIIAENLRKAGASGVLLSGSGASVFGMAHNEKHAMEICERVRGLPGCSVWSRAVRILPDGVMVAHGPLEARV
jgi:4-diphosphocytidyl-2-C-methyl-D-erythritol kinase